MKYAKRAVEHMLKLPADFEKAGCFTNNGEFPPAVEKRLHKIADHLCKAGYGSAALRVNSVPDGTQPEEVKP